MNLQKMIFILIIITIIVGFTVWSFTDMVCKPCDRLPDNLQTELEPDNPYGPVCPSICVSEPRWVSWLYS